jgi:hypothetical protein
MLGETKEHQELKGWLVGRVQQEDAFVPEILVIRGFVEGRFTKFAPIYWLDLDKKIVMTDEHIYKMGEPNDKWIRSFLAAGNCIHDIEMKDDTH